MGRGGMEPGVGRGAPATPPGARAALPVNGLFPVPARGVRVGVLPENGLLPGRGPAGRGAGVGVSRAAGASGALGADGDSTGGVGGVASAGTGVAAGGEAGAGVGAGLGTAAGGAAAAGAGAAGAAAAAGAADAGAAGAVGVAGCGVRVGTGARRTLEDEDVRRGAVVVGAESAPSEARSLRATGASTVEEAERANSPISLSFSRTCLLSRPSSFASSYTRTFDTVLLSGPGGMSEPQLMGDFMTG